jgi:hypothetical protein
VNSRLCSHVQFSIRFKTTLACFGLILLSACGGAPKQIPQSTEPMPVNLIEIPIEIGSSVELQLWAERSQLSKKTLKLSEDCAATTLPIELRLRNESIGLVLNGFPNEIHRSLSAIIKEPACLHSYLKQTQTVAPPNLLRRLAGHLENNKFDLGVVKASKASLAVFKPQLASMLALKSQKTRSIQPTSNAIQSRLKTYQSSGKGELRVGFPLHLPTPEALADFELVVAAIRSLEYKYKWASIKLIPMAQRGRFVLELAQNTPTKQIKSRLAELIEDICLDGEQWSNAQNFIQARKMIESELSKESDTPSAHAERMARTHLIFGSQANERWYRRLTEVGHHEWLKSVESKLQAEAVMIEVGVAKTIIGTPDFELAFFEEVLAEELRDVGRRKPSSVASTRSDILVYHKRPQKHQSLRVTVGLPERSRSSLTADIKQTIADCLRSNRKYEVVVDFEHGTLNLQSQFLPSKLDDVLDDWSEAFEQSCTPMTLPTRTPPTQPIGSATTSLHGLIAAHQERVASTGTQVLSHQNPMSAKQWWRELFAQRPPVQFFAAGPLGSEHIAPLLNRWQPWVPELTWARLAVSKSNLASALLKGERVELNSALYVPLPGLSPRRRVILDAVCSYMELSRGPAHCRAERSPYLMGLDVLVFHDVQPQHKGTVHQRVKRFLLTPIVAKEQHITDALRAAILENERAINSASAAANWMQRRLWEPGRGWLAKSLWNGLFPEESAVLELSAALKSLGEETL